MSAYYVMSADDAKRYLKERDGDDEIPLDDVQRRVRDGELFDMQSLDILREHIDDLKQEFPLHLTSRDQEGGRFEQRACELVHKALSGYPTTILADPEFWTWLAVTRFADIVEWRFGSAPAPARPENYGIGKTTENLLFRLWLRGDIGHDPEADDPYELARAGDQDLWRSHIIRQGYANARQMARALLRLQTGKLDRQRLSVAGVRELAKRLRRLHANVLFEALPAPRADALVLELSNDL